MSTSRNFQLFIVTEIDYSSTGSWSISISDLCDQNKAFKSKPWCFTDPYQSMNSAVTLNKCKAAT